MNKYLKYSGFGLVTLLAASSVTPLLINSELPNPILAPLVVLDLLAWVFGWVGFGLNIARWVTGDK